MKPFDLQVNGYAGVDFNSPDLNAQDLSRACRALTEDGVDAILATLITDHLPNLEAKLRRLARLREEDDQVRQMIAGIHVEGPFLNDRPGYIGAHPPEAVCPASVDGAKRLLEAGDGLIWLVTLAPECDAGLATTQYLAGEGVTVSAGHCDPTLEQLRAAIDHGLSMITHLGNGCPVEWARHDNFVQRALFLRDRLWICFIPDGIHIEWFALRNYLDLVGFDRAILVSDAIAAAGLGPGVHRLSGMTVEVDSTGAARKPGSRNLAGSTVTFPEIRRKLAAACGIDEDALRKMMDVNPRKAIEG